MAVMNMPRSHLFFFIRRFFIELSITCLHTTLYTQGYPVHLGKSGGAFIKSTNWASYSLLPTEMGLMGWKGRVSGLNWRRASLLPFLGV